MSFKSDQTSDDENLKQANKKSIKHSFLNNFKSSRNKTKPKKDDFSTQLTNQELNLYKPTIKPVKDSNDDDLIGSDIYPSSTITSDYLNESNLNRMIKKEKDVRKKPIVNAFIKGSSFSSSTSSSPPSPNNMKNKFSKFRIDERLIERDMSNLDNKDAEEDETEEEIDLNKKNPDQHYSTHHRSRSKLKYNEKQKLKATAGVCSASFNSISLNSDYDEEDFMDAFRVFDTDGDGRITAKELKNVLKELGIKMSKQDIKKMIKELDNDGNGTIEYSEFVQMMTAPASRYDDEFELREAFKCIDLDGNGFISREELKNAVKKIMSTDNRISVQDVEEMMKEADTDGNGLIDFDEFVRVLVERR